MELVFQDDGRGLALHGQRDLAVHFLEQHGLEAQRCDQHRVCLARQALQGHVVKDGAGLLADLLPVVMKDRSVYSSLVFSL